MLVPGDPKPAKNLEVVPAVAEALARRRVADVELVLTVSPDPTRWSGPLDEAMARPAERVPIRRIGQVPHAQLGPLYRGAAAVLLPSLAESFSATCVEAMHFGVPLVTSDRDFATLSTRRDASSASLRVAYLPTRTRNGFDAPTTRASSPDPRSVVARRSAAGFVS